MPELPEIETIRAGLTPHLLHRTVQNIHILTPKLRWPIPAIPLRQNLLGQTIQTIYRRGKYLLWSVGRGHQLLHLGMSGQLLFHDPASPANRHDHVIWEFDDKTHLILRDPRRFGALLWIDGDWHHHPLLANLGPEPLEPTFHADHLTGWCQGRQTAIKTLIMQGRVVVGVGNIYANEALFLAGVHPARPAASLTPAACARLTQTIKQVLEAAIRQGGTTLKDYRQSDGKPGYFSVELNVYGRTGQACPVCATPIQSQRLGQRSAFFCPRCQPESHQS
ncbi:MAG: bifunctional DNA-formamidopyrimidine glycosylase/DNA-(apurinic or apyrimidinic site) lyase [Magnetococcales bacterium]|nr:bifunctional DNA-formamidopyrimidine glycosylase/DNA-(apurinic or apyrimidinic site) lyase [Magnetococcales bacterium]